MKNFYCVVLFIILVVYSKNVNATIDFDFEKTWKQVEIFELKDLPKSALVLVDSIYHQAKEENNRDQIVKSLIYQSKFTLVLEEDAELKIFKRFEEEIDLAEGYYKNILQSVFANLLQEYFSRYRWQYLNRMQTVEVVNSEDFRTWDAVGIVKYIKTLYLESIENSSTLQEVPKSSWGFFVFLSEDQYDNSSIYELSLYDLLVQNSINFFKNNEAPGNIPFDKFRIFDKQFFFDHLFEGNKSDIDESHETIVLDIYSDIIENHKNKDDQTATAFWLSDRLEYLKNVSVSVDKESYYIEALGGLIDQYKKLEISAFLQYRLAHTYYTLAKSEENEMVKSSISYAKKAVDLCEKAMLDFPKSAGANFCSELLSTIQEPYSRIKMNGIIPIHTSSRIFITYKNLDSLNFKLFKLDPKINMELQRTYQPEERNLLISRLESMLSWSEELINENDFCLHSMEAMLPELENGSYLLLSQNPVNNRNHGYSFFDVSNLSYIKLEEDAKTIFRILDRNSGRSIPGASVEFLSHVKNQISPLLNQKFFADENGALEVNPTEYFSNLAMEVKFENDSIRFQNLSLYKNHNDHGKNNINVKAFIFTDRKIYRPGQKVLFKGILVKEDNGKSEIVEGESLIATLSNQKGQNIGPLKITTNKFGSFSSEFEIPSSGLTGNYFLRIEEDDDVKSRFLDHDHTNFEHSAVSISVEEYKRPRFEVSISEISEVIQVNDTVKIKGEAMAFSGNSISNGEVVYRIYRTTQMSPWYYRKQGSRYFSSGVRQEIIYGNTKTDQEGKFELAFVAIPDQSIDKNDLPVFQYQLEVEVTDINGETRTSEKIISAGYHSIILNASISEKIFKNSTVEKIKISGMNLNEQAINSKGNITFYKKNFSERVTLPMNKSQIPDYPRWSKEEFIELFPHDAYPFDEFLINENNRKKVKEIDFNTADSKEIDFPDYSSWIPGTYIVEISAIDSLGFRVIVEKEFELIDRASKTVSDNALFQYSMDKKTYRVDDEIHFDIGTAADSLFVTVLVEKKGKVESEQNLKLSKEIKKIKILVNKEDEGNIIIHYYYAFGNEVFSGSENVIVEGGLKPVKIVMETFRNKLEPGSKEHWTFKIKGEDKEKFASEVLAGMYDASLDQLSNIPNRWSIDHNERQNFYPPVRIVANNGFKQARYASLIGNSYSYLGKHSLGEIPDFERFGLSLVSNSYTNRSYLSTIRENFLKSKVMKSTDHQVQHGYVRGIVTDVYGDPLEFAVVSVNNSEASVNTNSKGEFYLKADSKSGLLIKYPLYKSERIWLEGNNVLHIMLSEEFKELDQITVTGYDSQEKVSIMVRGNSNAAVSEISDDGLVLEERVMGVNGDFHVPPPSIIDFDQSVSDKLIINQVKIRSDFKETAFFYPHLETNKKGEFGFSFDAPESLTNWKLMLLSHSKNLRTAYSEAEVVTQKELMITPNFPRFLREGDKVVLAAKVSNLSPKIQKGKAHLSFVNELTGQNVRELEKIPVFEFEVKPFESINVDWEIEVPKGLQLLQYKVLALTDDFSDGEQSIFPILEKKILITETMPVWANQGENRTFTFDKLKNPNSETIINHKLSFELTSNPLWYVLQTIPYIDDLSDENSEQLLSRIFVNSIGLQLVNTIPELKSILENLANGNIPEDQFAKNKDLKSIILEETPWLKEAESDENKVKRLGQLLDPIKLKNSIAEDLQKLKSFQMSDGGFVWYKGSTYSNFQMTNHILQSFGKLKRMNFEFSSVELDQMIEKGLSFLQKDLIKKFDKLQKEKELKSIGNNSNYLPGYELGSRELDVLYTLLVNETSIDSDKLKEAMNFYTIQLQSNWVALEMSDRIKAVRILKAFDKNEYKSILESFLENSISSEEMGNYWKLENTTMSWANSPIEIHAQMIDLFKEVGELVHSKEQNGKFIDGLVRWLLRQKQTNHWPTSKSTVSAVSAIFNNYSSWSAIDFDGEVMVGDEVFLKSKSNNDTEILDGGYLKKTWNQKDITTEMADVSIVNNGETVFWGALYWQYFEDLNQISKSNGVVEISKELFTKINTPTGIQFVRISEENAIKIGDLVKVRIEVKLDRDIDFVHLSDQRASGLEPIQVLSGYKFQNGVGYYESHKDASTHFYFDSLKKGIYVFEYEVRASQAGDFANGITKIESVYAPEFKSHTPGNRLKIK
ncbi:MG2 domain-containing protein [Belliella sp. DSM 107340]|uniref:MG2 domain-containing protein n=1 Tax=Belliella calami TaxID=2923436 RepID=A0ABS9UK17_9BACT|nr:alpha-2-macroglobulin family protein [Belliella calami]MCH7396959.1 MG2 domain-containing protein [Belliella calami]